MHEIYRVGLEWMMCLSELIIFCVFMSKHCKKRKINLVGRLFLFFGTVTLLYVKMYGKVFTLIKVLMSVLMLTAYGMTIFKAKKHMYLIYAGVYVLLVALSDTVCTSTVGILFPNIVMKNLMEAYGMRYIIGMISKVLILCLVLIISSKSEMASKSYLKTNLHILLLVFLISIICLYSLFEIKQNHYIGCVEKEIDILVCVISLTIFLTDMIIYWAIGQLNVKMNKEKEYDLIQYQNEWLTKAVLEQKEIEKEWRKNRHDFNNHISCIDMLLQMENIPKARVYIQKLTNSWQKNDLNIHIGNEIADAVINQKAVHAKKLKIDFLVFGQMDERIHIEDMDLCALLSNSLDNAIEAAKQVPEMKDRKIEIIFSTKSESMLIEVKNSVKENIEAKEQLTTTKKDSKRHGIGMMSMQTTTSKYGGVLEWYCEDYQFHLNIELPIS